MDGEILLLGVGKQSQYCDWDQYLGSLLLLEVKRLVDSSGILHLSKKWPMGLPSGVAIRSQ